MQQRQVDHDNSVFVDPSVEDDMRKQRSLIQARQRVTYIAVLAIFVLSAWQLSQRRRGSAVIISQAVPLTATSSKSDSTALLDDLIAPRNLELSNVYSHMMEDFVENGLDPVALSKLDSWFYTSADGSRWPRRYSNFTSPLPPSTVRLLVIPLCDSPEIGDAGASITQAVLKLLPVGMQVFVNAKTHYHCTVFHTSHPMDPRPDATLPGGGVDLKLSPSQRRPPTAAELARELKLARVLVASQTPPVLQVDRILLSRSGTLIMTWVDNMRQVEALRAACNQTFPGAPKKQASIIHTTLMRIVSGDKLLTAEMITPIQTVLDEWTSRLRSDLHRPSGLWYVIEDEFSTLHGTTEVLLSKGLQGSSMIP